MAKIKILKFVIIKGSKLEVIFLRELSIIYWEQQLNCYFKVKVWKKYTIPKEEEKSVLIYFEYCRSESSNIVHIHLSKRSLILKKFFRMKIFTFLVEMCFGHSYRIAVYKFLKLANNIFFCIHSNKKFVTSPPTHSDFSWACCAYVCPVPR